MANNYTQAAFTLPCKDPEVTRQRMKALEAFLHDEIPSPKGLFPNPMAVEKLVRGEDEDRLGFHWEILEGELHIAHDESINLERAVLIAQLMLDLDENDQIYTAEWAEVCDRARPGQFGGGAVAFNRTSSEWLNTSDAARQCAAKLG